MQDKFSYQQSFLQDTEKTRGLWRIRKSKIRKKWAQQDH